MEGALNNFIIDQRTVPGQCEVALYQFDDVFNVVWEHRDLHTVPHIYLSPRNMTALYDAVGKSINRLGDHFASLPEDQRPEKVVVAIITDGLENASKEFKAEQVRNMIKHQEETYGWAFTYIGANQDAYAEGDMIGVATASSLNYGANRIGTKSLSTTLSAAVTRTRTKAGAAAQSFSYTQEEQDAGDASVSST